MTVPDFLKAKEDKRKLSMITCYDAAFAKLINNSEIDSILIGDSCAMVMHGEQTTLGATEQWMCDHTKAVRKGAPSKFIVADMPFLATRCGKENAVRIAGNLLISGANAVKIEGIHSQKDTIEYLIQSGIPVMSHLGLTPQFYHSLGGHKIQGKTKQSQDLIKQEAIMAQEAGCFAIVLECVPSSLAKEITASVDIPVIGIGAGVDCDGQVLVLQDMLGMSGFKPFFVRQYLDGQTLITNALNQYHADVVSASFPGMAETK